jgi:hypothetical protein
VTLRPGRQTPCSLDLLEHVLRAQAPLWEDTRPCPAFQLPKPVAGDCSQRRMAEARAPGGWWGPAQVKDSPHQPLLWLVRGPDPGAGAGREQRREMMEQKHAPWAALRRGCGQAGSCTCGTCGCVCTRVRAHTWGFWGRRCSESVSRIPLDSSLAFTLGGGHSSGRWWPGQLQCCEAPQA